MPRIVAAAAAFPDHRYAQADLRDALGRHRGLSAGNGLAMFDHAGVEHRHLCFPLEYYFAGHGFGRRNDDYREQGLRLGERAVNAALDAASVAPDRVGHLLFVTTTGLTTPSLDALLAPRLGLPRDVLRTPLFGVGCAGGAVGLARAAEWLRGRPGSFAVLLSVELCGQTFLPDDRRKTGLVGAALFGDGAAAAVLAGDEAHDGRPGLDVEDSASVLLPESADLMGWDFADEGFRLVLSPRVPRDVREIIAPRVASFLAARGLAPTDVPHWILHPGGPRVMDAFAESLRLPAAALRWTRSVLADCGNLSSATVLVALSRFLDARPARPGEPAIVTAVGPGFAVEEVLLRCA